MCLERRARVVSVVVPLEGLKIPIKARANLPRRRHDRIRAVVLENAEALEIQRTYRGHALDVALDVLPHARVGQPPVAAIFDVELAGRLARSHQVDAG